MVLIRPVLGEPRMVQATPATSGGANSGRMLAAAMKPLNGVLVRTTIQENNSPITTAIAVPPPQATSVLNSASAPLRVTSVRRLACPFKAIFPSACGPFLLLVAAMQANLGDRQAAGKVAES